MSPNLDWTSAFLCIGGIFCIAVLLELLLRFITRQKKIKNGKAKNITDGMDL